jgi:hypothetical protein
MRLREEIVEHCIGYPSIQKKVSSKAELLEEWWFRNVRRRGWTGLLRPVHVLR